MQPPTDELYQPHVVVSDVVLLALRFSTDFKPLVALSNVTRSKPLSRTTSSSFSRTATPSDFFEEEDAPGLHETVARPAAGRSIAMLKTATALLANAFSSAFTCLSDMLYLLRYNKGSDFVRSSSAVICVGSSPDVSEQVQAPSTPTGRRRTCPFTACASVLKAATEKPLVASVVAAHTVMFRQSWAALQLQCVTFDASTPSNLEMASDTPTSASTELSAMRCS